MKEIEKELRKSIAMYTDTPGHVDNILALIKEAGYRLPDPDKDMVEFTGFVSWISDGVWHEYWQVLNPALQSEHKERK